MPKTKFGSDPCTMSESEIALGNLLAIIFRDGGQRLACIGDWQLAGDEGERCVNALRKQIDDLKIENDDLRARTRTPFGASPKGM